MALHEVASVDYLWEEVAWVLFMSTSGLAPQLLWEGQFQTQHCLLLVYFDLYFIGIKVILSQVLVKEYNFKHEDARQLPKTLRSTGRIRHTSIFVET